MRIEDIAREAGVSIATVSRVLNSPELVSPATRERVLEVVAARDYVPDSLARGLMTRRSGTVGVLVVSISNAYYMEMTQAIQRRLREAGLMMLLGATDDDAAIEKRLILDFASRRADGLIVVDPTAESWDSGILPREASKRPLILVHSKRPARGALAATASSGASLGPAAGGGEVFLDQELGMRKAMDHLWSLGHRRIAFLRGRRGFSYDIKEAAWAAWFRGHGLEPDPALVLRVEDGNTEEAMPLAEERLRQALAEGPGFSAVFACNDLQARGAVSAITARGLAIPGDISVMSHDNTILATAGRVQLSSIDLRMREVGLAAAGLLLEALGGQAPRPLRASVEPGLLVRDSTGPVRR